MPAWAGTNRCKDEGHTFLFWDPHMTHRDMGMVVQRHATQADAGWPNALALLSTLQRRKLRFDTVTLNAAIRAMAASGTGALWVLQGDIEFELETHILKWLNLVFWELSQIYWWYIPCVTGEKSPLRGACEASWRHALLLWQQMQLQQLAPDSITFGALINACGKAGCWQMAVAILEVAKRSKKAKRRVKQGKIGDTWMNVGCFFFVGVDGTCTIFWCNWFGWSQVLASSGWFEAQVDLELTFRCAYWLFHPLPELFERTFHRILHDSCRIFLWLNPSDMNQNEMLQSPVFSS